MRSGVPIGPLIATAVAFAAINVALASSLARFVARGPVTVLDLPIVAALVGIGLVAAIWAAVGWRRYLRRRA